MGILITFHNENLKDCLTKLLNLDNKLTPGLNYIGNKKKVKFVRSFLKQHKITFIYGKIVNIYIVYELSFSNHGYNKQLTGWWATLNRFNVFWNRGYTL